MADATILIGGYVKQTDKIEVLGFNYKSGYLIKFKYNNKIYTHIKDKKNFKSNDQNSKYYSAGYYEETEFLKYLADPDYTIYEISKCLFPISSLEDGVIFDKIKIKKIDTGMTVPFLTMIDISWDYNGGSVIDNIVDQNIVIPAGAQKLYSVKELNIIAKIFYDNQIEALSGNTHIITAEDKEIAAYTLAKIAIQIYNIYIDIFKPFDNDPKFKSYTDIQVSVWNNPAIFVNPTLEELAKYYDQLSNFYNAAYSNLNFIKQSTSETKLYWLAYILSKEAVAVFPVAEKIELLKLIAKGTIVESSKVTELSAVIVTTIVGDPKLVRIINEEAFVVKIVESVLLSNNQHDDFLSGLTNLYYSSNKNVTLFETLYNKVNDYGGEDYLKQMVNSLYKIWILSSYNPYNLDGTMKEGVIVPSQYINKAVSIGYKADTVAWIFNETNYNFDFESSKIIVKEPVTQILEQTVSESEVLIGSYGIYQTVTIKNTEANTGKVNFISITSDNNNSVALPIFYLKYIDDKKFTENLITTVHLTVDILLTASGIGNLSKLRHIRTIYKLGRIALNLETASAGDLLATYEFAQGVAGVVEITGSIGNMFVLYSHQKELYCEVGGSQYNKDKCEFYTKLDNIFLVMQLFGGALDLATSQLISNSSRKLLEGPIPDDFNPDTLAILRRFAGDIDELKEIFRVKLVQQFGEDSEIWKRIQRAGLPDEFTIQQRNSFIYDFVSSDNLTIFSLNIKDGELIDIWKKITFLSAERRRISYLMAYKRFIDKPYEFTHIIDIHNKKVFPAFDPLGGHSNKNIVLGEILDPTNLSLPDNLKSEIIGSKNGHITYSPVYFKKPLGSIGGIEYPTGSGVFYKKKSIQTIWNPQWSDLRIKEEMAYAFDQKKIQVNWKILDNSTGQKEIIYKSFLSDGTKVEIKMRNFDSYLGRNYVDHLALFTLKLK